jgi:hypothetical protein
VAIYNREPAVQLASRDGRQAFRRLFLDAPQRYFFRGEHKLSPIRPLAPACFARSPRLEDGAHADPPTFQTAVPNSRPGDVIPLPPPVAREVEVRGDDADQAPTLIVENAPYDQPAERVFLVEAAERHLELVRPLPLSCLGEG